MASYLVSPFDTVIGTTVTPVLSGAIIGGPSVIRVENLGANSVSVEVAYSNYDGGYIIDAEASNDLTDIAAGSDPCGTLFNLFPGAYLRLRATASGGSTTLRVSVVLTPTTQLLSRP